MNDSVSMMVAIALFMVMKYGFTKRDQSLKITHLVMEYYGWSCTRHTIHYVRFGFHFSKLKATPKHMRPHTFYSQNHMSSPKCKLLQNEKNQF